MKKTKYYAGIGSRQTPKEIQKIMTMVAETLATVGYILRSGGAEGADTAFEAGANSKEIYLPWPKFNRSTSNYTDPTPRAFVLAQQFHPAWNRLSGPVQKLMARNAHQVLGQSLDSPVDFIICWTPKGLGEGGTGQALRMAEHYDIPVLDLGLYDLNKIQEALISFVLEHGDLTP